MTIKIGKRQLFVKDDPEIFIDGEKGIMSIVLIVEDEDGGTYELHYLSSMEDPDLVVTGSFFAEL